MYRVDSIVCRISPVKMSTIPGKLIVIATTWNHLKSHWPTIKTINIKELANLSIKKAIKIW